MSNVSICFSAFSNITPPYGGSRKITSYRSLPALETNSAASVRWSARLILHTRTFDVFAHDAVSCLVVLDKIAVSSAARERLNAKLTGARKQVEHLGTAHMILYQIEYVFFYPIGGRAGVHAGHGCNLQPRAVPDTTLMVASC